MDEKPKVGSLVVQRRVGERLLIGEDIVVEVIESKRGHLRLRVTAPRHVIVWREEVIARGKEASQ